ncbi:hypothetical protein BRM30_23725, partial [Xanthomonas oryzae pv. oryzae]
MKKPHPGERGFEKSDPVMVIQGVESDCQNLTSIQQVALMARGSRSSLGICHAGTGRPHLVVSAATFVAVLRTQ